MNKETLRHLNPFPENTPKRVIIARSVLIAGILGTIAGIVDGAILTNNFKTMSDSNAQTNLRMILDAVGGVSGPLIGFGMLWHDFMTDI